MDTHTLLLFAGVLLSVVVVGPDKVEVTVDPLKEFHTQGFNVTLSCSAQSSPPAEFTWAFNGIMLKTEGQELKLENIQENQSGSYTCWAHNIKTLRFTPSDRLLISVIVGAQIRLVNGDDPCSGRVEIYHNYQWGTVCDDIWDINDAEVACRQVGCGRALAAHNSSHFGEGSGHIWLDDLRCRGNESALTQCPHNGVGSHNCVHHEDAGVVCSEPVFIVTVRSNATDLVEFDDTVELTCSALGSSLFYQWHIGSSDITASERVHLSDDNRILTISGVLRSDRGPLSCTVYNGTSNGTSPPVFLNISFGPDNVEVTVDPLKEFHTQGSNVTLSCSAQSSPPAEFKWLFNGIDLNTKGQELKLENIQENQSGSYNCLVSNSKSLTFTPSDHLLISVIVGAQIRLVNGDDPCSGRVEIYHNHQWGTVCDDIWDINDAEVACRQVGCGRALYARSKAHFGQGSGHIWLDDLRCRGNESALTQCPHKPGVGSHDCGHHEDAGVVCLVGAQIRLVNGDDPCSGRVEIYHNYQWGTVCDDYWDINDAEVACRQVGCGRALASSSNFVQGSGHIWLDDLRCRGNESALTQCPHHGFGSHNCVHREDAGVVCSEPVSIVTVRSNATDLVEFDDTVELTCSALGSSLFYQWHIGSSDITASERVHLSDGNRILTISGVLRSDRGPLSCTVYNVISNGTSPPVFLNISFGPDNVEVTADPLKEFYTQGSNVTLSCSAQSSPPAEFIWLFNGIDLNTKGQELKLENIQENQSGSYICFVSNSKSLWFTPSDRLLISLIEKISGASITGPTEVLIAGNRSANLSCQTTAGTIISRKWLKDGRPLSPSNRITFSGDNSSVSIDPLQGTDNGKYQCILTNPVSTNSASYDLTVNYGPVHVLIQGRSEIEVGYTVVLTCSASSVPPATFTWTLNGKETAVITEEYTVENATFSNNGTYACVAKNSVTGSNMFSASHVLTVKESNSGSQLGIILGGIFGAVACVTVAGGAFAYMKKRKRRDSPVNQDLPTVVYENTKDLSPTIVYVNLPTGSTDLSGPVDAENRRDYEELRFKDTANYSTINSL